MGGVLVNSRPVVILGASGAAVSGAADTNENTLATITVPAGAMGANGIIRISCSWSLTNSANNKILRQRFSGGAGTIINNFTATTQPLMWQMASIYNISTTVQSTAGVSWAGAGNAVVASTAPAVDTTATTTVVITGQKASAGETLTLVNYLVELIRS